MDELLVQAALELVNARYPKGWGRAALRTKSGTILTSACPETKNDALSLCMEVEHAWKQTSLMRALPIRYAFFDKYLSRTLSH